MAQFQIVELTDGKNGVVRAEFGLFDDGRAAAEFAKSNTTPSGNKLQVRPVAEATNWQDREQQRFTDGTYQPVNWADRVKLNPDHFLHIAKGDPNKVAFTESPEKGIIDRQTVLPVNRYLVKYQPQLNQYDRRLIYALHRGIDPTQGLKFATTEQEITDVYVDGPESCMSGATRDYASRDVCHPTAVYAAGDLAVAYLEDDDGAIIARAICWPAKKIYGRIYGAQSELQLLLDTQGYCFDHLGFEGARLLVKEAEGSYDDDDGYAEGLVMPYIDFVVGAELRGEHLVVTWGGPYKGSTCGVAEDRREKKTTCPRCDEATYAKPAYLDGKYVCPSCGIKAGVICAISGTSLRDCRADRIMKLHDGRSVYYLYQSQTFECPHTGQVWLKREGIMIDDQLCAPTYKEHAA